MKLRLKLKEDPHELIWATRDRIQARFRNLCGGWSRDLNLSSAYPFNTDASFSINEANAFDALMHGIIETLRSELQFEIDLSSISAQDLESVDVELLDRLLLTVGTELERRRGNVR